MAWRIVVAVLSCLIFGVCTQPRKLPPALPPRAQSTVIEYHADEDDHIEQFSHSDRPDEVEEFLCAAANATFDSPTDPRLRLDLKFAIRPASVTESLAVQILAGFKSFVEEQTAVESALNAAFLEACKILRKMRINQDDEIKCTLVALGALALVAPWLMPPLGVREIGFMKGDARCPKIARINITDERAETWIARWQEEHKDVITREVLYLYLKQLGMSFSLMV